MDKQEHGKRQTDSEKAQSGAALLASKLLSLPSNEPSGEYVDGVRNTYDVIITGINSLETEIAELKKKLEAKEKAHEAG